MAQSNKIFSKEMIDFLRNNAKGTLTSVLTERLNEHFGTNLTSKQIEHCKCNYGITSGLNTKFQRWHTPANKGVPMSEKLKKRCSKNWFKKGDLPMAYKPVGTTRVVDGYTVIKVDSDKYKSAYGKKNTIKNEKWIKYHHKVWIDNYGDIPPNHLIIFLDGDKTNFNINNLACVTKQVHARMNQNHRYLKNGELTETLLNITELENVIREKRKNELS